MSRDFSKSYMIDFETLGNGKNACVVQVGVSSFDKTKTFKRNIDPRTCQRNGADLDADTVLWWLGQSDQARQSIMQPGIDERIAFTELNAFLADAEEIWSHATFDFVILMETLKRLGIKSLFSYRSARDIRTLVSLAKVDTKKKPRTGVHHDALDDSFYQVDYCVEAMEKLDK